MGKYHKKISGQWVGPCPVGLECGQSVHTCPIPWVIYLVWQLFVHKLRGRA